MASLSGLKIASFVLFVAGLVLAYHEVIQVEGEMTISSGLSEEEELEFETQLNILNKTPVKTIHTDWGDMYDCIEFHKQPAFDHPLLKHRAIPKKDETASPRPHKTSMGLTEGCPKGTVPIRRTTKEDLIRAKSLSTSTILPGDILYKAGITLQIPDKRFFGASAIANVWNPKVGRDQWSGAEMTLRASNNTEQVDEIRFGWMVNPILYGDNVTRTYTYWTGDGGVKTGCYNALCPGFVQDDPTYTPFFYFKNTSVFGGKQMHLPSYIHLEPENGDWWLTILIGDTNIKIGYWPKELFRLLRSGAEYVYWGGRAKVSETWIAPEMASGKQLDVYPSHNGYFYALRYTDEGEAILTPDQGVQTKVDCKGKGYDSTWDSEDDVLMYGGPGGPCV